VEAGSNISTVTLRVVGGDEKGRDGKIWSRVPKDWDPRKTALSRTSSIHKRAPHESKTVTVKVCQLGLDTKIY
jgi:hypothetical protein